MPERRSLKKALTGVVAGAFIGLQPLAALAQLPGERVRGDPVAGEKAAKAWCAQCHVIGDYNPYGGVGATPSFWIMKRKPATYYPKLKTFQRRRPHAARQFDLTPEDIDNILKYVDNLEPK